MICFSICRLFHMNSHSIGDIHYPSETIPPVPLVKRLRHIPPKKGCRLMAICIAHYGQFDLPKAFKLLLLEPLTGLPILFFGLGAMAFLAIPIPINLLEGRNAAPNTRGTPGFSMPLQAFPEVPDPPLTQPKTLHQPSNTLLSHQGFCFPLFSHYANRAE